MANLKTGSAVSLATALNGSPSPKPTISRARRMLTSSEIASLRRDLKQTLETARTLRRKGVAKAQSR